MYCVAKSEQVKMKTAAAIFVGSGRRCNDEEYNLHMAAKGLEVPAAEEGAALAVRLADDVEAPSTSALLLNIRFWQQEDLIVTTIRRGNIPRYMIIGAMRGGSTCV